MTGPAARRARARATRQRTRRRRRRRAGIEGLRRDAAELALLWRRSVRRRCLVLPEAHAVPLMSRVDLHHGYIDNAPAGPFDGATCLLTLHFLPEGRAPPHGGRDYRRLKPGAPFVVAPSQLSASRGRKGEMAGALHSLRRRAWPREGGGHDRDDERAPACAVAWNRTKPSCATPASPTSRCSCRVSRSAWTGSDTKA